MKLKFNFYDVQVVVDSEWLELNERLLKDFHYFIGDIPGLEINVKVHQEAYLQLIPKELVAISQSQTCLSYYHQGLKYNDYYGDGLVIFDSPHELAQVYSTDLDRAHEIIYLFILSRVGIAHDRKGIHRLHALAVTYRDVNVVGMMPMKGGKSTLFMDLIKEPEIEILSDDSPLINQRGEILPFPIRVGLQQKPDDYQYYTMNRKLYGEKFLIDVFDLNKPIGTHKLYTVLFQGKRSTREQCEVVHCSKLKMLSHLFRNLIVGLGLPMIIEYFLEPGLQDKIDKAKISWLRLMASLHLLMKSDCYEIHLTSNLTHNKKTILEFLNEKFPNSDLESSQP